MKVLALTHAHLKSDGLSPVSCERADSIVLGWAEKLNWEIDIIHTRHTRWAGIWPEGAGLKANIIGPSAPQSVMMHPEELFSVKFKSLLHKKNLAGLISLLTKRITKKARAALANKALAYPAELQKAKLWGKYLSGLKEITGKQYDFIFVCVGHGDEYLLQTAFTLSEKRHTPMIVDFRDLWSDHHDVGRFTDRQRKMIRKHELRLLSNAVLLSVPQKPMAAKLVEYMKIPVHVTPHSAYIDHSWQDGQVVNNEFRMLYAGKIYAGNEGLSMLLEMLQKLSLEKLKKTVKCHFFIDDGNALRKLTDGMEIDANIVIHNWVSPAEIWKEMRSAHLLLIFDGGFYQRMPLIMTKTFQYALTGRPILALSKYGNTTYEELFKIYGAGVVYNAVDDAVKWVKGLSEDEQQYQLMPELRKVPSREEIAVEFGLFIENVLNTI